MTVRVRPRDDAAWWILGSNAFAILVALRDDGGLLALLWIFWCQSVVIGWFARQRMLALRRFSTEGLLVNDQPVLPTPETQRKTANFFAMHYGVFHLAYLLFLGEMATGNGDADLGRLDVLDWFFIATAATGFWHSHRESHRENVEADLARLPNIGSLMFLPYVRILPMHLAIILGATLGQGGGALLFGALKTGADLLMHKVEHRWLQGARKG